MHAYALAVGNTEAKYLLQEKQVMELINRQKTGTMIRRELDICFVNEASFVVDVFKLQLFYKSE